MKITVVLKFTVVLKLTNIHTETDLVLLVVSK